MLSASFDWRHDFTNITYRVLFQDEDGDSDEEEDDDDDDDDDADKYEERGKRIHFNQHYPEDKDMQNNYKEEIKRIGAARIDRVCKDLFKMSG